MIATFSFEAKLIRFGMPIGGAGGGNGQALWLLEQGRNLTGKASRMKTAYGREGLV